MQWPTEPRNGGSEHSLEEIGSREEGSPHNGKHYSYGEGKSQVLHLAYGPENGEPCLKGLKLLTGSWQEGLQNLLSSQIGTVMHVLYCIY